MFKNSELFKSFYVQLEEMSIGELKRTLAKAIYHLYCLYGSRNSFVKGSVYQERTTKVQEMHEAAGRFLMNFKNKM